MAVRGVSRNSWQGGGRFSFGCVVAWNPFYVIAISSSGSLWLHGNRSSNVTLALPAPWPQNSALTGGSTPPCPPLWWQSRSGWGLPLQVHSYCLLFFQKTVWPLFRWIITNQNVFQSCLFVFHKNSIITGIFFPCHSFFLLSFPNQVLRTNIVAKRASNGSYFLISYLFL